MVRRISAALLILLIVIVVVWGMSTSLSSPTPDDREEVVFWHFWSGPDGEVVEDVIRRFNQSQDLYFVRGVSMPGNNFDMKLFLSVTGGDPPDLLNQDDPIVADWAFRKAIFRWTKLHRLTRSSK